MNKQKLTLLQERLEQQLDSPESARFNMKTFGSKYYPSMNDAFPEYPPVCGTQACLAGETVLSTGQGKIHEFGGILLDSDPDTRSSSSGWLIQSEAAKALELTKAQAQRLFFFKAWNMENRGWPIKYQRMYENAKTPQGRLYAAIRRVERFIETDGRE